MPMLAAAIAVAVGALILAGTTSANAAFESDPTVTGYVFSPTGTPLAGIDVKLIQPGYYNDSNPWPNASGDARTDSSGHYVISGHQSFTGSLEFYDENHVYATAYLGGAQFLNDATPFDDTGAIVTATAPDMTMQPGGWISSVVTRPDGTQATDFGLSVYAQNGVGNWQLIQQSETSELGSFSPWHRNGNVLQSAALPAGEYRICVGSLDAEYQCEGDTATAATSTPILVATGASTEADFALQTGNSLSGVIENSARVADPTGGTQLWWLNPDTNVWFGAQTSLDGAGGWEAHHLRPGRYKMSLPGDAPESVYYPDAATLDTAGTVDVVSGQTNPSIVLVEEPYPPARVTSTSLTLSSPSAAYGDSNHVTATVNVTVPGDTAVPDGTVMIEDFGPNGGVFTLQLVDGSASLALPADLDVGSHGVEAYYYGDQLGGFAQSQSTRLPLVVAPRPVDVRLTLSSPSEPFGRWGMVMATATVHVAGSNAVPHGSVSILVDGREYRPGDFLAFDSTTGVATLLLPGGLTVGTHRISARFAANPDGDYVQSTPSDAYVVTTPGPQRMSVTAKSAVSHGRRVAVLTVSVVQPGSHPYGAVIVSLGGRTVARGSLTAHGDVGSVQLTWTTVATRARPYVARFVSSSGQPPLVSVFSVR